MRAFVRISSFWESLITLSSHNINYILFICVIDKRCSMVCKKLLWATIGSWFIYLSYVSACSCFETPPPWKSCFKLFFIQIGFMHFLIEKRRKYGKSLWKAHMTGSDEKMVLYTFLYLWSMFWHFYVSIVPTVTMLLGYFFGLSLVMW